jgi:hypothetical protein
MATLPTGKSLEDKLQEAQNDLSNLKYIFALTVQCPDCHALQGKDCGGIIRDMGTIQRATEGRMGMGRTAAGKPVR